MHSDELNLLLGKYVTVRQDRKNNFKNFESLRKKFVKRFPPAKTTKMAIDDYVEGKQNLNSFCYWVEWETTKLGKIQGARADKFGLYFSNKNTYKYLKRYTSKEEALQRLLSEISRLIELGRSNDDTEIEEIALSPMFKGKILFLYFPNYYLNIFTDSHVNHFLSSLGIYEKNKNKSLIQKRAILLNFKNAHSLMKGWTTFEYTDFLYYSFQRPIKSSEIPESLKDFMEADGDYIDPSKTKPLFIDVDIIPSIAKSISHNSNQSRNHDFDNDNKNKQKLGLQGELVVFYCEQKRLKALGFKKLAARVKHIAQENSCAGYDILSYDTDGNEIYIEVKSTKRPYSSNECSFMITANEVEKANSLQRYFIYLVFEANKMHPKVLKISTPKNLFAKSILLEPVSYRARLSTRELPKTNN
jgi:hypothetical protein